MNIAKTEAVCNADAALSEAGLPTYTEIVGLISAAASLGLKFEIGNAYIRRSYIEKQDELMNQVKSLVSSLNGTAVVAHGDIIQSH